MTLYSFHPYEAIQPSVTEREERACNRAQTTKALRDNPYPRFTRRANSPARRMKLEKFENGYKEIIVAKTTFDRLRSGGGATWLNPKIFWDLMLWASCVGEMECY